MHSLRNVAIGWRRREVMEPGGNTAGIPSRKAIEWEKRVVDEKILFVDDDVKALLGYERTLHREFLVNTATGGAEGLETLQANGPYAIVISDMRMPGMSGAEFLAHVRQRSPNTVRMVLTGYADLDAAVEAVNMGNIVRYLTKPCKKDDLVRAIEWGLEQYRSTMQDRGLIKKALLTGQPEDHRPAAGFPEPSNFESPTSLPGPLQAKGHLASICGVDPECYAVFFKLVLLAAVSDRYGPDTAAHYLNKEVQFLLEMLGPEDRLFHWNGDLLLGVVKRQSPLPEVSKEISGLISCRHEQVIDVNGRSTMIAGSIEFDLLPVAMFSTCEELLAGFAAKS